MTTNKTTPKELWARQQISGPDVDYDLWNKKEYPCKRSHK